jgi:2-dehydro-3-deoxygluconokinase
MVCLHDRVEALQSRRYQMAHLVESIGAGDVFAAGLIYGWSAFSTRQEALDFAAAAGCLKHTIPGDFCRSIVEEVLALIREDGAGRILR